MKNRPTPKVHQHVDRSKSSVILGTKNGRKRSIECSFYEEWNKTLYDGMFGTLKNAENRKS